MKRPDICIEDYREIYDFYRDYTPSRVGARLAYAALNQVFKPQISYAPGAREDIASAVDDGDTGVIIAPNHLTYKDQYPVAASAWNSPLRPIIGKANVLAKDELFHGAKRPMVDLLGAIPTFRAKDYGAEAIGEANKYMTEMIAQGIAENGKHIALFPEGTCNLEDPRVLLPLHTGIARIALRAQELGRDVAIVPMGLSYGDKLKGVRNTDVRHAAVYLGNPIIELDENITGIMQRTRAELQNAADRARSIAESSEK